MLPIMTRGTWGRTFSIRKLLEKFVVTSERSQIVSLGAGFDTNFFYLKKHFPTLKFIYYEVDHKEVVDKKMMSIMKEKPLAKLILGEEKFTQIEGNS